MLDASPVAQAAMAAVALAVLHLGAGALRFLDAIPRSRWLSLASGISVGYVFVHLLPELAEIQAAIDEDHRGVLPYLEDHSWLFALGGLIAIYGLERLARHAGTVDRSAADGIGWVHIGSYSLYNGVVGYLLEERAAHGVTTLVLFATAMGLHFVVNDHGLRQDHGALYHRIGRWLVAGGVLAGWAVSAVVEISEPAVGLLTALLGGGVILNVLKEELPEARQSRWVPFALGAGAYAALLLLV